MRVQQASDGMRIIFYSPIHVISSTPCEMSIRVESLIETGESTMHWRGVDVSLGRCEIRDCDGVLQPGDMLEGSINMVGGNFIYVTR